ncbi:hypothetical protein ACLQ15_32140, partial [Streptomyces sp. DT18]
YSPSPEVLENLAEKRLADLDAGGIPMQVLSGLGAQTVPAAVAPALVAGSNDKAAAAVRAHPPPVSYTHLACLLYTSR